jgi:hypothetical protein
MVYQCPKCKRRWQQPVKVCPYCLVDLERMESFKKEIVVSSKVSIPSLFHMSVPYVANIIKDENDNFFALKSEGKEELKSNPQSVAVFRIKYDIIEALEEVFRLLEIDLKENSKVLVIPTVVSPDYSYARENTSPEMMEAVLDFLLMKKIVVKVGAQSFNEIPIEGLAQKSGLLDVCLKKGITPFNLALSNFVKNSDLEISEEVLNSDLVINISMLKAGRATSTDNVFKILKKENYSGLKYLSSEKDIADKLIKSVSNVLTIGEAEIVQRANKITTYLGLIFGGYNFLKVDSLFNRVIKNKGLPEVIKDMDPESIIVSGRSLKEVEQDIEI